MSSACCSDVASLIFKLFTSMSFCEAKVPYTEIRGVVRVSGCSQVILTDSMAILTICSSRYLASRVEQVCTRATVLTVSLSICEREVERSLLMTL